MDSARYREISLLAEADSDAAMHLEMEVFADPDVEKLAKDAAFHEWALKEGDRYIQEDSPEPDPEEIEKMIDDLDF